MRGLKSKPKRISEVNEIELLESWIEFGKPESGSNPLACPPLPSKAPIGRISNNSFSRYIGCNKFSELPLSKKTKDALSELKFIKMKPIQMASIPHALCGHNIIGASKTGTGKSLAFIIPVLEKLYRMRWGPEDGIGSIIISPTRELAYQLFQVLKSVGKHHSFSVGLLMGGRKDVETEKEYVNELNILVCTPGRLLHHMNATPNFDCSQLQVLVLDEADRILGPEFRNELDAIISQLPKHRQALLFSATLTNSSKGLGRIRLKDPEYLNVDQKSVTATPKRLLEWAIIVPLDRKLDFLWSFITSHLDSTILVFFSTRKQVKFAFEVFKKLQPGIPLTCLYGKMNVEKRMYIYSHFCEKCSVLFATDVAGRGLEFPKRVDWVVQVDCPDNFEIYTHRVGRTARNHSAGNSLLFLMPSEIKMLNKLKENKVPIQLSKSNPKRLQSVYERVVALLVKYDNLRLLAQRAFVTYLKSINKKQDNDVFDVMKLPIDEFSASLGLPMTPKVRFLNKKTKIKAMAVEPPLQPEICSEENMLEFRKRSPILNLKVDEVEDTILRPKENPSGGEATPSQTGDVLLTATMASKKKRKRMKINPNRPTGIRTVFDAEGEGRPPLATLAEMKTGSGRNTSVQVDIDTVNRRFVEMREEMKERDKEDKLRDRLRRKDQRQREERKKRLRKEDMADQDYVSEPNYEGGIVNKKMKLCFDSENEDDEDSGNRDYSYDRSLGVLRAADPLSLAEQEKLALKLLSSMHS